MKSSNKLYFGRIAPTEPQKKQVEGGGWAWRYKVRILDKHPHSKDDLPDEDLPWAQVLMPVTAGSGAANYAQTPAINQGDTVSIAYYDDDEQQPVITGILPRTADVSTAEPSDGEDGYTPHTGFTENKNRLEKVEDDESNENNTGSQRSARPDQLAAAVGSTVVGADNCDPNAYKSNAVTTEINNLLNEVGKFADSSSRVESMITGTIDRVHALVNPYVGQMFFNLYEALVPVLNAGLSALYKKVFAIVLAKTGSPLAARLAAEAALISLIPAILALQEAIQLLAAQVVKEMLTKIEDLVRDTLENNDQFTTCAGTQFNGALVNSIINDIDTGIGPLLAAVAAILSGGFSAANSIRSTIDIVRDFAAGLLSRGQGGNKCGGMIKEYVIGIGAKKDVGDILGDIIKNANLANTLLDTPTSLFGDTSGLVGDVSGIIGDASGLIGDVSGLTGDVTGLFGDATGSFGDVTDLVGDLTGITGKVTELVGGLTKRNNTITRQFGDFPFLSQFSDSATPLTECSTEPPSVCESPRVNIFGGRGRGATATAFIGRYVDSVDVRTVTNKQGGVVSIQVDDGGEGYVYPPFVEVVDDCKLGRGCSARSVIKDGKVARIYIVTPGEGYPSASQELFVVDEVEVIDSGSGYSPGIVEDNYGGQYEVITNEDGRVTEILPKNIVQVPDIPVINVPRISPEVPPGGKIVTVPSEETSEGQVKTVDKIFTASGKFVSNAKIGRGLIFKPILVVLPTAEQVASGEVSDNLIPRLLQTEVVQVIDCVED